MSTKVFPPGYEAAASELWKRLDLSRHGRVLACFMTTRQPTGAWPAENFGKAFAILRSHFHIVLCGAAGDRQLLSSIDRDFDLKADIMAGDLSLRALACFLRRFHAVFTTDSGPRHIANAAGVPVIFVRNVWFNAVEAGVYVDTETDLCGPPNDGDRGDGVALLAAIDPAAAAAAVVAAVADHVR